MANPTVTLVGNLVSEVDLKFIPSGKAVASFSMVTKDSKKGDNGEWTDVDETFYRISVWEKQAEHLADCALTPGDPLIVVGPLRNRKYETREGDTRYSLEVTAREIGVSLKRYPVTAKRPDREKVPASLGGTDDAWGTPAPATDEPPF